MLYTASEWARFKENPQLSLFGEVPRPRDPIAVVEELPPSWDREAWLAEAGHLVPIRTEEEQAKRLAASIWNPNGSTPVESWQLLRDAAERVRNAAETEAPNSSNTGASNRHDATAFHLAGGLDWLDVCLWVVWPSGVWEALCEKLAAAKLAAQENDGSGALNTACGPLTVGPKGSHHGPIGCEWRGSWNGIDIHLVNAQTPRHEHMPNVFVHVGSCTLMEHGHETAWLAVLWLLKELGADVQRNCVSRADLCVDLPGVHIDAFMKRYKARKFFTLSRKGRGFCGIVNSELPDWNEADCIKSSAPSLSDYWSNLDATGFTIGRGVMLRVYDKLAEVEHQEAKRKLLEERRWGGPVEQAVRVEFQLRRDQLRELWSVSTVEDLFGKLATIAGELTTRWVRFVQGNVAKLREHGNQDRAKLAPEWVKVQEAFAAWCGGASAPAPRKVPLGMSGEQLKAQAFGCLAKFLAMNGEMCAPGGPHYALWELMRTRSEFDWAEAISEGQKELTQRGIPVHVYGASVWDFTLDEPPPDEGRAGEEC